MYYKKYTDTVQASDYIEWANQQLYMDILEVKKLASMSMKESLNLFEIEEMFADAMKSIQRDAPTKEQCLDYHLKCLHSQLLMPTKNAVSIVKEIYECTITHDLFEEQMNWQEISDAIDDFQYGDNYYSYTMDRINEMIVAHARKLWHTKLSNITFEEMIGQKVTAIESEVHFIIQLEKGAIIIECPWRIRNASEIVMGETDIRSNQREWNSVRELLIGKKIEDVQLLEQCPLLIVQFGNIFLDVFHASSFFDGWTLTDEENFYMFSMHGGNIA
ncbi:hypothetical protein J2S13_003376 [Oikeobacillus pervagus]|uniref:Uncharacterized protein n=1 Tax=Oikeobacillus pervagus TaxID=1325931 RepID=A0AAJ1T1H8_9BACI|nr:hypothetical protein [Oikeobacillus pervagus]MDQ0216878.1 hypothetical protein [Oikeobacillus pervagus]